MNCSCCERLATVICRYCRKVFCGEHFAVHMEDMKIMKNSELMKDSIIILGEDQ